MSEPQREKLDDCEAGLVATGGSEALLSELIEIFLEECPKVLAGIRTAVDDRSAKDLRRHAHTLRGSLRYFGETQAGVLSAELEAMGEEGSFDFAGPVLKTLEREIDRLLPELQKFVRDC